MARSWGCSLLAAFAVASWATACKPKPAAAPTEASATETGESRGDIEMELRGRLARVGDACAKQEWLKELLPKTRGLQAEITEDLLAEEAAGCRRLKQTAAKDAPSTPAPSTPAPASGTPAPASGTPTPRRAWPPMGCGSAKTR